MTELLDAIAQSRATFRAFFEEHCPPEYADACDSEGRFPHELFEAAAVAGLFRVSVPEAYGGLGFDPHTLTVLLQEAGRAFPDFANTIVRSQTLCMTLVDQFGSAAQKQALLPWFADGTMHMAVRDLRAGRRLGCARARHHRPAGRRRLRADGRQALRDRSDVADAILVIGPARGHGGADGLLARFVEPHAAGMTITRHDTLGVRATGTASIELEACACATRICSGRPERGSRCCSPASIWSASRPVRSPRAPRAACSSASRTSCASASSSASPLETSGRAPPPREHVDAHRRGRARGLPRRPRARRRQRAHLEAAIAKLAATETYMAVAHRAVQLEGGWGYTFDRVVQRHFRDAKMYEIGGGASDVQRDIIGKRIGL